MLRIILAALLFAGPALGQSARPPVRVGTTAGTVAGGNDQRIPTGNAGAANGAAVLDANGNASALTVLATGGTTARTEAERAGDVVNVKDFGAKCDGSLHLLSSLYGTLSAAQVAYPLATSLAQDADWAAISRALAVAKTTTNGTRIVFPPGGNCVIATTLNFTAIQKFGMLLDGGGATLTGQTSGTPIIDALGTRWLRVRDLTVIGSTTNTPNIGMQIGRTNTTALNSSDNLSFENVFFSGNYSFTTFYNLNSETTKFDHVFFWNSYNGTGAVSSYTLVQDGMNHFNATSAFVMESQPVDIPQSFNENLFINCDFRHFGGGQPIWSANTNRNRYISSYAANTAGAYGMVLFSKSNTDGNNFLDVDMHFETTGMTDVFFLTGGNAAPLLTSFKFRDQQPFASNSVFKLDIGLTSGLMSGATIEVGTLASGAHVFDAPSVWTVSGSVYVGGVAGSWNLASTSFVGSLNQNGIMGPNSFQAIGNGLALNAGTLSVSLPTPLNLAAISVQGGVTSASVSGFACYKIPSGGTTVPYITFTAPPLGGTQTTGIVSALLIGCTQSGNNFVSAGSGYSINDILTMVGGTCPVPIQMVVSSVSSGAVVTYSGYGNGYCTSLPAEPISWTGGTGTGLQLQNIGWLPKTLTVISSGGGYISAPAGIFSNATGATLYTGSITATTVVGNNFTATGGVGSLVLNATGTVLGTSGALGSPVVLKGAVIDNSGVRQTLTSAYTVPANTSLVRFIQTGTLAASTVTLPTPLADGQPIQFSNYAGTITALTFSPVVSGWTNTSAVGAYQGIRVRWDATSAAWIREQ